MTLMKVMGLSSLKCKAVMQLGKNDFPVKFYLYTFGRPFEYV